MGLTRVALEEAKREADSFHTLAEERQVSLETTRKLPLDAKRSIKSLCSSNSELRASLAEIKVKLGKLDKEQEQRVADLQAQKEKMKVDWLQTAEASFLNVVSQLCYFNIGLDNSHNSSMYIYEHGCFYRLEGDIMVKVNVGCLTGGVEVLEQ